MENGLPQNSVHALAQTADGFLWLGTEAGLVRFDGIGFTSFDHSSTPGLPSGDIRNLLETPDGTLWVGTAEGLARRKDGSFARFGAHEGPPEGAITALRETPDGRLRVETAEEASEYGGGRWLRVLVPGGLPKDQIVFKAKLANGEPATATRGTVVIQRGTRPVILKVGHELPGTRIQALFADREGCLWIGTNGGLARWVNGKVQRFLRPIHSPALRFCRCLKTAKEISGWARKPMACTYCAMRAFTTSAHGKAFRPTRRRTVVEDSAGTIWVGTSGGGLNVLQQNRERSRSDGDLCRPRRLVERCDSFAGRGAEWRSVGGHAGWAEPDSRRARSTRLLQPTDCPTISSARCWWMRMARCGSARGAGLTHWTFGSSRQNAVQMETYTQANGLGSDLVGRDGARFEWQPVGGDAGRIVAAQWRQDHELHTANGLSSNVVTALLPRAGGTLLIGTQDHGWNLWDGKKFSAVQDSGLNETSVHAILDDGQNHLWFATAMALRAAIAR